MSVRSVGEAMEALRRGARARQKASTALNYASSRSHSIFTIAMFASDAAPAKDREVRRTATGSYTLMRAYAIAMIPPIFISA